MGKNGVLVGECQALIVERHVARLRDGARHQFLAGAGRAGDQRGEFAHARVERAAVAPHIVREDGLPDGGAQARRGHGTADDVAEDLLEGALDLAEAGEGVARIVRRRDRTEVSAIGQEVVVEAPARRVAGLRARIRLRKTSVVALIEKVQDRVFVEQQVLLAQVAARLRHHRLQLRGNAPHILARPLGVVHLLAPDRLALLELGSQHGALQLHPFRQKGIAIRQVGNRPKQRALLRGERHEKGDRRIYYGPIRWCPGGFCSRAGAAL